MAHAPQTPIRRQLDRDFYARPSTVVAPALLNKVLVVRGQGATLTGRITETEAYAGADDPGSHGYRGVTPRTEIMFGPPGYLYVYFTYGMHWCANAVTEVEGECGAVLIRSIEPIEGIDTMRARRMRKPRKSPLRERDLTNGPAKICQAMGLDGDANGVDLTAARSAVRIIDDGQRPPARPGNSTRIGLSAGADIEWRWFVDDR